MEESLLVEHHPLTPYLPSNSRVLMLGSFPPPRKRWSMDFFYPNVQNDMWRIYGYLYYGDRNHFYDVEKKRFRQQQIEEFLCDKGIAVFDTAVSVKRLKGNASDQFLEIVKPTPIRELLEKIPLCKALVATGGKAAGEIAEQLQVAIPPVGKWIWVEALGVRFYRMPSSSRSYPLALEKKAETYRTMLQEEQLL